MMERLLLKIHQRLQGSSTNPPGLSVSAARLFDEHGQEIKNPLLLKNGQKIWFSSGKAYRLPLYPVLGLTFDRVAAFSRDGVTIAYKTFLDPNAALLPACDSWEISEGFSINFNCTSQQIPDQYEKVDLENHFLQSKVDPSVVLHASVSVGKLTSSGSEVKSGTRVAPPTLWPAASVWLITKTGVILSRAVTQGCLAVGHPIRVKAAAGPSLEGYRLILQRRHIGDESQKWVFGTDGCIYSKAYPWFVLTYLEELNAQVDVTQRECHSHHSAWTTAHQERGRNVTEEVLQKSASNSGLKQLPEPSDTHITPEGSLEETGQLTVALVRKLEEKHPKASAQRWAIKHEGTRKPGQWKHSRVDNPLWNKLTYTWPVLPSGQLNQEFDWPMEGLLVRNSPPLKKPAREPPQRVRVPVRLRVVRNGDLKGNTALVVTGLEVPSAGNMQNVNTERREKICVSKCCETERSQSEFHQLLERCTEVLNLPTAAQRLFSERGKEIFSLEDLQREELVYVSCGEHWVSPEQSVVQQQKQLFLRHLASDVGKIQAFCSARKLEGLVLEVQGDIVSGAKLAVHKLRAVFGEEKQIIEAEEKQMQKSALTTENASSEIRLSLKCNKLQKLGRQQFEYRDGQIISHAVPQLVLGVQGPILRSGVEVVLVERSSDGSHQHWVHRDDSRTFHLVSSPDLVLAVSLTKTEEGVCGCPVIVQKYKPYTNGTANQKWCYMEKNKVFMAFCSTVLDKEITSANYAGVCTSSVIKEGSVDQPGYYYLSPDGKRKTMLCSACGRSMRAERELKQMLPGVPFLCASGSTTQLFSRGPFKVIRVAKADLSSHDKAEKTLSHYKERLLSLRMETCLHAVPHWAPAAARQKAVKVIAHKNGAGFGDGKFIVARTFPMLLTECTEQLGLARAASTVYTRDGTAVHSLRDLVLWALEESCIQTDAEGQRTEAAPAGREERTVQKNLRIKVESKFLPDSVGPDSLDGIDKSLLALVLRNPVAIWVSCGEPFLPPNALQKEAKTEKQNWLKKDKILADLGTMKHKLRQLKGRRVAACQPPTMVPTQNPVQPVLVEGGWTEQTQEEIELVELIRHTEACLSEVQELQSRRSPPTVAERITAKPSSLCKQPSSKRVWAYPNGGRPEDGTYAWGRNILELLEDCTHRLQMAQPARALHTPDGELVQSWDDIGRDTVICVSPGSTFITWKESKQLVKVRANYARARRQQGPQATDVVLSPSAKLLSLAQLQNSPDRAAYCVLHFSAAQ
ncbi:doublecortin domain-containing protein 1 [Tupaia chinensis]|uniref:doublecortin domain-containing protein 1 n=1 Tax=Tupaia chinensis TaxID=246437 RepID=UPI0003C8FE47|nr:doublecortin domain-containing protein 1 [Tupaia chinensis]